MLTEGFRNLASSAMQMHIQTLSKSLNPFHDNQARNVSSEPDRRLRSAQEPAHVVKEVINMQVQELFPICIVATNDSYGVSSYCK
jgi:hypothetical protein